MSKTIPLDPFKMWKNIYDQTESSWSDIIQQSMKKDSFSEGMGETLNQFLQFQELSKKMTASYLEQVNVPSREEVANVASLIINLEEKVDNLEDNLEKDLAELNYSKEIGQLRRAVTNLDKKMDKILEAIEGMNNSASVIKMAEKNEPAKIAKDAKK